MKKIKYLIVTIICLSIIFVMSQLNKIKKEKEIEKLVCDLSDNNSLLIREEALERLTKINDNVIPLLRNYLERKGVDERTKVTIIQILSKRHSSEIALELSYFLKDKDWKVRFFAAQVLGQSGNKKIVSALLEAWKNEKNWQVIQEIAVALWKIGDTVNTTPLLMKYFSTDTDIYLKTLSAVVLYEFTKRIVFYNFLRDVVSIKGANAEKNKILFTLSTRFSESPNVVSLLKLALNNCDEKTKALLLETLGDKLN